MDSVAPRTVTRRLELEDEFPLDVGPRTLRRLMRRQLIRVFVKQWAAIPGSVRAAQQLRVDGVPVKLVGDATVTKVKRVD